MQSDRKKAVDMTAGPLVPNIIKFVIPLACTGILQQLFNAADLAVVGRFVGKEAMAAVGSNSPVIGIIINLFVGISMGANIVIAQASGRNDDETIEKAVHSSILVAVISGFGMFILGEIITKPLITLLSVPANVYDMAVMYLRIYLVGMPVIFLYNFESAIFRSRGHSQIPLYALAVSGIYLQFYAGMSVRIPERIWNFTDSGNQHHDWGMWNQNYLDFLRVPAGTVICKDYAGLSIKSGTYDGGNDSDYAGN